MLLFVLKYSQTSNYSDSDNGNNLTESATEANTNSSSINMTLSFNEFPTFPSTDSKMSTISHGKTKSR